MISNNIFFLKFFQSNNKFKRSKKPWRKDMNAIGVLLARLVTRDCKFTLENDAKDSSLGSNHFCSHF